MEHGKAAAVVFDRQKGELMKETVYRCDKCRQLITDTRHKIAALNEAGQMTKYEALFEEIDLCEKCMALVSLAILDIVEEQETAPGDDPEESTQGQQDTGGKQKETSSRQQDTEGNMGETSSRQQDTEGNMGETSSGQQEGREHLPEETKTYQCSKVIKTCKYAGTINKTLYCDYIGIAKHSRGCEPEQCDKYEKVARKRGRKRKMPEGES